MCGGVTAYTACKRSAVKPGQWIVSVWQKMTTYLLTASKVLPGAGGGLGHFAVQYAKSMVRATILHQNVLLTGDRV
jgi:alcohol dehydrogenase, propanol-preferring